MNSPQAFMRVYEAALASQDWNQVAPLIHKDACVTFSNGTYKGKTEVQEIFERNFSVIQDEEYSMTNIHWAQLSESYAVCLFSFHWQGLINGQPASGGGRGTSTLVNEDGSWKLLTEHLGPNPQ